MDSFDRTANALGQSMFLREVVKAMAEQCELALAGQMHQGSRASVALKQAIRLAETSLAVLQDAQRPAGVQDVEVHSERG